MAQLLADLEDEELEFLDNNGEIMEMFDDRLVHRSIDYDSFLNWKSVYLTNTNQTALKLMIQ